MKVEANQHEEVDEEVERCTSLLFRAPEQLDTYSGYSITEKVDIFALGCIIYTLLFLRSPFEKGEKLDQMNARYTIPKEREVDLSPGMHDLLVRCLEVDPAKRVSSLELWDIIDELRAHDTQKDAKNTTIRLQESGFFLPLQPKADLTHLVREFC